MTSAAAISESTAGESADSSTASTSFTGSIPVEYLTFRLANEEYGIDILRVREIRSYEIPTRIPNAPQFVDGVINLRGVIVPIIDLRLKMSCESSDYTALTVVIVLKVHERILGIVVDSVSDVVTLVPSQIKPAPDIETKEFGKYIIGIGCVQSGDAQRMLILMDIEAFLRASDIGMTQTAG